MGYFKMTYFDSFMHADTDKKRDLNGTSVSKEKGTDGKANNTSAYNHDYYIHHKEKWQDNKDSKNSKDSDKNKTAANGTSTDDKSGLKEGDFDLDAAALDVIRGKYGNGQARKDALGADYEMIQKRVNEMYKSGKFGGGAGTAAPAAGGEAAAPSGNSGSSERSTQWYKSYNNKIADSKAAKAEKELQERAAKEAQEKAAQEAAAKKSKSKSKK